MCNLDCCDNLECCDKKYCRNDFQGKTNLKKNVTHAEKFKTLSSPIPRGKLLALRRIEARTQTHKKLQSQNQHSRGFWLSTKYLDADQINAKRLKKKSVNMYTPTMQYPDSFVWLQVECASLIIELTITRQNKT